MGKDKFEELACEFKNEAECEEEIDEERLNKTDLEKRHFEEWDEKDNR